jgi:hypothetical protein
MAWTTPYSAASGDTITAARFNSEIRDSLLETEAAKASFTGKLFFATGTNAIKESPVGRDIKMPFDQTTSTSYVDELDDGCGPSVCIQTGTSAVVFWSARMSNSTANATAATSISVTDSADVEVLAPLDAFSMRQGGITSLDANKYGMVHRVTGLTPGLHRFRMVYRASSGTAEFSNREIFVIAQ